MLWNTECVSWSRINSAGLEEKGSSETPQSAVDRGLMPKWLTPEWLMPEWLTPDWLMPQWLTPDWLTSEGLHTALPLAVMEKQAHEDPDVLRGQVSSGCRGRAGGGRHTCLKYLRENWYMWSESGAPV